ncbi:MAG TPA: hypothetical protein VG942_07985 [Hyphomonadaceae bacterium]|nr:hypothetical protein [Hyphomonadaceae bacterium]
MGWAAGSAGMAVALAMLISPVCAQTPPSDDDRRAPDFSVEANCLPKAVAARGIIVGESAFAVLTVSGALSNDCVVISMHNATYLATSPRGAKTAPLFFFRREETPFAGPAKVDYADSRTCPGAMDALRALENFKPLGVHLIELHPIDRVVIMADGAYYGLWSNATGKAGDVAAYNIETGGWNYRELEDAYSDVADALKSCWSGKPPRRPQ